MSTRPTIEELTAQAEAVDAAFDEGAEMETPTPDPVVVFANLLVNAIATATALNADAAFRSRELSLAITNLEQAQMWAQKAAAR